MVTVLSSYILLYVKILEIRVEILIQYKQMHPFLDMALYSFHWIVDTYQVTAVKRLTDFHQCVEEFNIVFCFISPISYPGIHLPPSLKLYMNEKVQFWFFKIVFFCMLLQCQR